MVQAVENWADVTGVVRNVVPAEAGSEQVTALVEVERVTAVAGFPNFFADAAGSVVPVTIRQRVADTAGVAPGAHVTVRVQKATPARTVAHPDGVSVEGR